MIKIDQFIYTAAATSYKKGYQVISKSDGITDKLLSEMSPYFLPPDIDSSEFSSSKSLLVLSDDKIAYSNIHNIGIGYDGRPDTLYNHTLVLDIRAFQEIHYDTRYLDSLYIENPNLIERLPVIEFSSDLLVPKHFEKKESILKPTLKALFKKSKIAIVGISDNFLIQNILGLVPPSMRIIPFSTLVVDVNKQPHYDFVIVKKSTKYSIGEKFVIINPNEFTRSDIKTELDESIDYLYRLISHHDQEKLQSIYEKFENIPNDNYEIKLILLTFTLMLSENRADSEKQRFIKVISKITDSFELEAGLDYLNVIRDSIPHKIYVKSKTKIEISGIEKNLEAYNVTRNSIESLLSQLSDGTSESWQYLLQKLYSVKKEEFGKNAITLLFEFRYSFYNTQMYNFFVSEPSLHKYLQMAFADECFQTYLNKKLLFESIISIAIKNNCDLVVSLLEKQPFDFDDAYEISSYQEIIKIIVDSKNFISDSDFQLKILNIVYNLLENTMHPKRPSGIMEPPNSIKKRLLEVAKLLDSKIPHTDEQKMDDEVKKLQLKLKSFIADNKVIEPYFDFFSFFK